MSNKIIIDRNKIRIKILEGILKPTYFDSKDISNSLKDDKRGVGFVSIDFQNRVE